VAPELMRELGEKGAGTPELLAVAEIPADDFSRIPAAANLLVTFFGRPSSPGNLGTLCRAVDAFGGTALVVTGHAADPYDPKCVRASTGSLFSVPVIRAPSHREILAWVEGQRARGLPVVVIGTDERGSEDIRSVDFAQPIVLVIGNESTGLTAAWRESCDVLLRIPMVGTASSLNAATAGSIVLYEAMPRRAGGGAPHQPLLSGNRTSPRWWVQ
jgi:23S rRNA (uridine2479-2'-O)-methyltransferase